MSITKAEVALRGKDETAAAFRSVVRNAETAQKQITTKMRAAFNFLGAGTAIYGLGRSISGAIRAGDELEKFAQKSGLAAEAASELAHAAKMQDIELSALATSIKKMQVTLSEAGSGGKNQLALLKALGIEFEHIRALRPDQQFELIAEQISKLEDPADRTRAAVEMFGRAGADLLPLFEEGAEGIRKLREETARVFTADDLKRLADADDAMKKLKASTSALGAEFAIRLGPTLTKFFDELRVRMGGGNARENAIAQIEQQIDAMKKAGQTAGPELDQLQARLDLLLNPRADTKRGRVAGDSHPVLGFLKTTETQAKLTKKELEELEAFMNQDILGRQQEARLDAPLGGSMAENDAALRRTFDEINRENIELRDRTIQVGTAFEVADENAKDLMATLKDEGARRMFDALSDALMGLGEGVDDFAKGILDAFRRILADYATKQLIMLFQGMLSGSGGSSGGFLSSALGGLVGGLGSAGFGGGSGGIGLPRGVTPITPRAAVSMTQYVSVDARGADAGVERRIESAMEETKNQAVGEMTRLIRGGAFAG